MPVWTNPSITSAPAFTLVSWAVYEEHLGDDAPVNRTLLVRWVTEVNGGSSPVVAIDPATTSFRTRSDRIYRVTGAFGNLSLQGRLRVGTLAGLLALPCPPREVTAEVAREIALAHGEQS